MTTSWGEERRIELGVHHALEDMRDRLQHLEGRDRYALQSEFLEWSVIEDFDDLEVQWIKQFYYWDDEG